MSKIKYYLRKLKGKSFNLIIKKVINILIFRTQCEIRSLIRTIKPIKINGEKFMDYKTDSKFFLDNNEFNNICEIYQKDKNILNEIVNEGDKVCSHIFPLLGNGSDSVGKEIVWNKDYISGYIWENKYYKKIELVNYFNNADIKWPWELSRFQHVFTLGKAYSVSKNEKYAIEFRDEINDWIKNNPIEMSVNWTCSMDIAIRAVNWIVGYYFFGDSKSLDLRFWAIFHECLYNHGKFIMNNLENKKHTTNHYLSNLLGLIWLGIYFKNYYEEESHKEWLRYGISELNKEIDKQINLDGTDYETSTSYHRLVTEILFYINIYCERNNVILSIDSKIKDMFSFIYNISKSNGKMPIIGDADDGRILIPGRYYNWDRSDVTGFLEIAENYYNINYSIDLHKKNQDKTWILGVSDVEAINIANKRRSLPYKSGGFYVLRNNINECIIRCGKLSCNGQGGHSHNDQLSIELCGNGIDLIIDPGVYVYTSNIDERNLFRSTTMHNTVEIEELEQNAINKYDLFSMNEQSFAKCLYFDESKFIGEHIGFKEAKGVIHRREVKLEENNILIEDVLEGNDEVEGIANFILDSNIKVNKENGDIFLRKKNKVIAHLVINNFNDIKITESFIARQYGVKEKTQKISLYFNRKIYVLIKVLK